jgi:hypothetical protein
MISEILKIRSKVLEGSVLNREDYLAIVTAILAIGTPENQRLQDAALISWDLIQGNSATVVLAGNRTLSNPSNIVDGQVYMLEVVQDVVGSRTLTYGNKFVWPAATAPTLTTTANFRDFLTFVARNGKLYGVATLNFA